MGNGWGADAHRLSSVGQPRERNTPETGSAGPGSAASRTTEPSARASRFLWKLAVGESDVGLSSSFWRVFGELTSRIWLCRANPTEPKVTGSNPVGRAAASPAVEGFLALNRTPFGDNGGADVDGGAVAAHRDAGRLRSRLAVGGGLSRGWQAAQAVGAHLSRGPRD